MSRFNNVETSALLDMLANYTRQLTELFLKNQQGEEYQHCKQTIKDLQAEIERRTKSKVDGGSSLGTTDFTKRPPT